MSKYLILILAAHLAFIGSFLRAQESVAPIPDDSIEDQLDLGEPADGPRLGERYIKETFGDWDLGCVHTELENDPCSLIQLLSDENGNPSAEVSIFRLAGRGPAVAAGTIVVPLETLLTEKLTLSVDGAPGKRYNFSFCNRSGCVVQIGLTNEDIEAFQTGIEATIEIVPAPAPERLIAINMSLQGFSAGYDVVDIVPTQ
ncbi:MAG: invasion associated locus B family protein [Aestuariivita sp.]|nr:invasion associated locus B family protein [Aestuariivita sp.]